MCEAGRLQVSHFSLEDAGFILRNGPLTSYARSGYGLSRVALKGSDEVMGMCGLIWCL